MIQNNPEDAPLPIVNNIPKLRELLTKNHPLKFVSRDDDIKDAITIMMINDYSQLPVMQNARKVDGYISWRSIGEAYALGRECTTVGKCMKPCPPEIILDDDTDLLDALKRIFSEDFILVRSNDKQIIGIVTTWDITTRFIDLVEPFLLIGKIECIIRQLIDDHFTPDEIKKTQTHSSKEREIKSSSDLTFGDYIRLLENEKKWNRFSKYKISRSRFIKHLEEVNATRNETMHFRQIGIPKDRVESLRNMAKFLEQLC